MHAGERHAYEMIYERCTPMGDMPLIGTQLAQVYSSHRRVTLIRYTSHRRASLTGVQLSQGMHITGFQILALTAGLTQTVPIALRSTVTQITSLAYISPDRRRR
jgi:hypothetical protein